VPGEQDDEVLPLSHLGDTIRLTAPALLALYSTETGELGWGDGSGAEVNEGTVMPFIGCGPDAYAEAFGNRLLDSSADLVLPVPDLDSLSTVTIQLYFSTGTHSILLVVASQPIPRRLLISLLQTIADDLNEEAGESSQWRDLARHAESYLTFVLRRRIRDVEESVRAALADDAVTDRDYAALRKYPDRLAKVEQLNHDIPKPYWQAHSASIVGSMMMPMDATNLAEEARESAARLSSLISSQAVVVAQRQAVEAERQAVETLRFQRLVTLVGAAVLVPGLVAAVFGANVGFRGQMTSRGFWAMLLLMASSALASYAFIRSRELGIWSTLTERVPGWLGRPLSSDKTQLAVLGFLASAGVTAGVVILLI
jgi:hypothetical protein